MFNWSISLEDLAHQYSLQVAFSARNETHIRKCFSADMPITGLQMYRTAERGRCVSSEMRGDGQCGEVRGKRKKNRLSRDAEKDCEEGNNGGRKVMLTGTVLAGLYSLLRERKRSEG